MKPGTKVRITGLVKAPQHNGKIGFVSNKTAQDGRVGVKLLTGGTTLALKAQNLEVMEVPSDDVHDVSSIEALSAMMPPPLFGLPRLKDKWGLTDLSKLKESSLSSFKDLARAASTPEAAEKAVFLAVHQGQAGYEPMAFPWLFPMGTGHFAQESRRVDVRFEEYVGHLLRQSSGAFLNDEMWIDFAVTMAAILRASTELPPMYKEEQDKGDEGVELMDPSDATTLSQFVKAFPKKSFCIRYLLGDKVFYGIAMIIIYQMTADQREEVFNTD